MNIEGQAERKEIWSYETENGKTHLVVSLASCKHSLEELKRRIVSIPGVVFDPANAVREIDGKLWVAVQEQDQVTRELIIAEVKRPIRLQIRLPNQR